jgi:hypothetical protein
MSKIKYLQIPLLGGVSEGRGGKPPKSPSEGLFTTLLLRSTSPKRGIKIAMNLQIFKSSNK